jgi:hypothetical protein
VQKYPSLFLILTELNIIIYLIETTLGVLLVILAIIFALILMADTLYNRLVRHKEQQGAGFCRC